MLDEFWETATPDDLPGDLGEIAHLLGMPAARYFAEHWSGALPYVAAVWRGRAASDLDEIAAHLGEDAVHELIEMFGGSQIYIPAIDSLRKHYAWHVIRREFDGTNAGELAARLQVSRRHVLEVVASKHPPQHERPRTSNTGDGGSQMMLDLE